MTQLDLHYGALAMSDETPARRRRTYTTSEESPWQRRHSKMTQGPDTPIDVQPLPLAERDALIRELIQRGLGDCSIAVRLNKQGVECSRGDVHFVRTGLQAPDNRSGLDEIVFHYPR